MIKNKLEPKEKLKILEILKENPEIDKISEEKNVLIIETNGYTLFFKIGYVLETKILDKLILESCLGCEIDILKDFGKDIELFKVHFPGTKITEEFDED